MSLKGGPLDEAIVIAVVQTRPLKSLNKGSGG